MMTMGIHAMVALDDSRTLAGAKAAMLKAKIAHTYLKTHKNGGTTLSIRVWRTIIQDANTEQPENLEAAGTIYDKLLSEDGAQCSL